MEGLGFGRYLAGWGALLIALLLAAWLPARSLGLWDPLEAVLGVLVAGIVDLPADSITPPHVDNLFPNAARIRRPRKRKARHDPAFPGPRRALQTTPKGTRTK